MDGWGGHSDSEVYLFLTVMCWHVLFVCLVSLFLVLGLQPDTGGHSSVPVQHNKPPSVLQTSCATI